MNMYLDMGSQAIGALNLADRIENWDPEHQAKLRQVGLRSSFELDDEEGHVFFALSPDHYPIGVMGRRSALGELFVSEIFAFPHRDFEAAVDNIKQRGVDLILGSEANELLCKMEQVKGVAPRAQTTEIWEVENWGDDEWAEQVLAELAFAMALNVQHPLERGKLHSDTLRVIGCAALQTVWYCFLRTTTRTSLWR
jgi:sugar (pentulose or hexulose) kinase